MKRSLKSLNLFKNLKGNYQYIPKGEAVDVDAPKAPKPEVDGLAPKRLVEAADVAGC